MLKIFRWYWRFRTWTFWAPLFLVAFASFAFLLAPSRDSSDYNAFYDGRALWYLATTFPLGLTYLLFEPLLPAQSDPAELFRAPFFTFCVYFPIIGTLNALLWLAFWKKLARTFVRGFFVVETLPLDADATDENAPKTPPTRRRFSLGKSALNIAVWSVAIAAVFCGARRIFVADAPLKFSPETTVVAEPPTADGKRVDYVAWARSREPANARTDANGFYRLIRDVEFDERPDFFASFNALLAVATPDAVEFSDEERAQIRRSRLFEQEALLPERQAKRADKLADFRAALGIAPNAPARFRFLTFNAAREQYLTQIAERSADDAFAATRRFYLDDAAEYSPRFDAKYLAENAEFLEYWAAENAETLDFFAETLAAETTFYFPWVAELDSSEERIFNAAPCSLFGEPTELFAIRAALKLRDGDVLGAANDAATLRKFVVDAVETPSPLSLRLNADALAAAQRYNILRSLPTSSDFAIQPLSEQKLSDWQAQTPPLDDVLNSPEIQARERETERIVLRDAWADFADRPRRFRLRETTASLYDFELPAFSRFGLDFNLFFASLDKPLDAQTERLERLAYQAFSGYRSNPDDADALPMRDAAEICFRLTTSRANRTRFLLARIASWR